MKNYNLRSLESIDNIIEDLIESIKTHGKYISLLTKIKNKTNNTKLHVESLALIKEIELYIVSLTDSLKFWINLKKENGSLWRTEEL